MQNVRQKSLRHTFMMWANILQEKVTIFFFSVFCFWEQFSIFKLKNLFDNLKQVENKNSFHSQNTKEIENRLLPIFYSQLLKNTEKIIWESHLMNLRPSSNPTSNKTQNFNNFFPLFLSHMMGCFSALHYVEVNLTILEKRTTFVLVGINRFQGASIYCWRHASIGFKGLQFNAGSIKL